MKKILDGYTTVLMYKDFNEFYSNVLGPDGLLYKMSSSVSSGSYIFRGHSSDKYLLLPKVLRENEMDYLSKSGLITKDEDMLEKYIRLEKILLHLFGTFSNDICLPVPEKYFLKDNLNNQSYEFDKTEKWIDKDYLELAMLAQHFGIHTRLLDWSYDFYVALYFSIISHINGSFKPSKKPKNIAIWCMDNAELSMNKYTAKMFGSTRLNNFFIVNDIYYKNRNIGAQKGLFTLWQVECKSSDHQIIDRRPLDVLINSETDLSGIREPIFYKLVIPSSYALDIYKYLHNIGYYTSRLFPDYSSIKKMIDEKFITVLEDIDKKLALT